MEEYQNQLGLPSLKKHVLKLDWLSFSTRPLNQSELAIGLS